MENEVKKPAPSLARGQRSKVKRIERLLIISLVLGLLLVSGCSRTITILPSVGDRIKVEITFRGNVDTAVNKYYILFGSSSPNKPYPGTYFFGPGESYDTSKMNISTDLNYYYTTYFSGWSDHLLLSQNNYWLTNGPFTSSALHSSYVPVLLDTRSGTSNKISLTFYLSRLSSVPAELYFNFVSVDRNGYLRDYLHATDNRISTTLGSETGVTDEISDPGIDPGLDILSWSITVQ